MYERGNSESDGRFLCEQFDITRWVRGQDVRGKIQLREMGLISPSGSGLLHCEGRNSVSSKFDA